MIEDYDEINHFIYNKIEKYNEKFAEFKKNLDLQDQKIKKECSRSIKKQIKKNPTKMMILLRKQKKVKMKQKNYLRVVWLTMMTTMMTTTIILE